MPILFSAVLNSEKVLEHFASCDGNFLEIAKQVVSKVPALAKKMTYSHGIYLLHYIAEDDKLYFCITDRLCQRSRAFLFLNEIQRRFKAKDIENFTSTLAAEMYRYSEDYSTITIRQGELDEVNSIGVGCSETILGEKILHIKNPENISYSTITNVSKTPEQISISTIQPRIYVVIIGMLALIVGVAMYTLGPLSCAVVICVIAVSYLRFNKKSKED